MKKLVMALALASAGCSGVEQRDFEAVRDKVDKLELELKNKNDLQVHLFNELVQKHTGLGDRVTQMDVLLRSLQATSAQLEDRVKALMASQKNTGGDAPVAAPSDPKKREEIILFVKAKLNELRQGKIKTEDAVPLLLPYADQAAPLALDELVAAVTNFDYAKQLETILSKLPSDSVKVPLQAALKQRGLRESAARIIGQTKAPDLGKLLEEHGESNDEDFKLLVGESLVLCKNAKGLPILIISLRSGEVTNRTIAIAALKKLAQHQDFGYRPAATHEQNATAVKSWEEWYEKGGKTIFD
jgi:hypothetical protein